MTLKKAFWQAGKSSNFVGQYDPDQLAMGIEVEFEHTISRKMAEKIAKDHLAEDPIYYTKLKSIHRD